MIDIERTLLVCPIEIVVHFFVISGGFTMKKKVLKQMQELSDCGYVFTRVTDQYQCEQLLPDQMDATLDSVVDTPAYQHVPSMRSVKRTFLVIQRPSGDVVRIIWLKGRQADNLLERTLRSELFMLAK